MSAGPQIDSSCFYRRVLTAERGEALLPLGTTAERVMDGTSIGRRSVRSVVPRRVFRFVRIL